MLHFKNIEKVLAIDPYVLLTDLFYFYDFFQKCSPVLYCLSYQFFSRQLVLLGVVRWFWLMLALRVVSFRLFYVTGRGSCECRLSVRSILPLEIIKLNLASLVNSLKAVPHGDVIELLLLRLLLKKIVHKLLWLSLWLGWRPWRLLSLNERTQHLYKNVLGLNSVHENLLV